MNPLNLISQAIGGIVSPVTSYFEKKNTNKTNIKLKQIERIKNADDAVSEWESIMAEKSGGTWKDEYVTIIVSLPIVATFLGVFWSVFTGDPKAAEAASEATKAVKELIPDYGNLVSIVFFAAMGIKFIKK